jgi:hypothetical protein
MLQWEAFNEKDRLQLQQDAFNKRDTPCANTLVRELGVQEGGSSGL